MGVKASAKANGNAITITSSKEANVNTKSSYTVKSDDILNGSSCIYLYRIVCDISKILFSKINNQTLVHNAYF